jgi:CHASE2 domain-containing sensor protein
MRSRRFAVLGVAGLAMLATLVGPSVLSGLDLRAYDALGRTVRYPQAPSEATIVAIDEASLLAHGRWPWPRTLFAELIERLWTMGASTVALDVLFAEAERLPNSVDPVPSASGGPSTGDERLAEALTRGRVVTAYAFVFPPERAPAPCTPRAMPIVQRQRAEGSLMQKLNLAMGAVCGLPAIESGVAGAGFINSMADADGLIRRSPLLVAHEGRLYPSLALATVQQATGGAPILVEERLDGGLDVRVGRRRIHADAAGRVLLGQATATRRISAGDVLAGRASGDAIRNRIVIVGPTAVGLGDTVATPDDDAQAGVELHAAAVDGLLTGRVNRRLPFSPMGELVLAVFAGAAALTVSWRLGHLWGALVSAAMIGVVWIAAGLLLSQAGVYVSPLYAIVAAVGCLVVETGTGIGRERRHKQAAQRLIVQTLASITETRSAETGRHARRTEEYSRLLTSALAEQPQYREHLSPDRVELIATLAPLHDIGKVGVSDAVLHKTGPLNDQEMAEMRRHPGLGYESLVQAERFAHVHDDDVLALAKEIVHTHHERWDGKGYPRGLTGADIPIAGRIVALVDVYDALVMDRPYRRALTHAQAVEIVTEGRGMHFDPDVVDAFLSVNEAFEALASRGAPSGARR